MFIERLGVHLHDGHAGYTGQVLPERLRGGCAGAGVAEALLGEVPQEQVLQRLTH
jgi:hypothetical protein